MEANSNGMVPYCHIILSLLVCIFLWKNLPLLVLFTSSWKTSLIIQHGNFCSFLYRDNQYSEDNISNKVSELYTADNIILSSLSSLDIQKCPSISNAKRKCFNIVTLEDINSWNMNIHSTKQYKKKVLP